MIMTFSGACVARLVSVALLAAGLAATNLGQANGAERQDWSFAGFFGQFDKAQLQRGFQIYQERCSTCHGLKRVYFRNLIEPGGPELSLEAVKAMAAAWPNKPLTLDDAGKQVERTPTLADPILGPYRNEKEARAAQNGALPPDFSVLAKARGLEVEAPFYVHPFLMARDMMTGYQEGGADYIYGILHGYGDIPKYMKVAGELLPLAAGTTDPAAVACANVTEGGEGEPDQCVPLTEGLYYNAAFPGHQIAMVPPLAPDNFITYQDGSGSFEQNTRDIAAFMFWAADPQLNQRKQIGWEVILYLLVTTALLYFAKRRIWKHAH